MRRLPRPALLLATGLLTLLASGCGAKDDSGAGTPERKRLSVLLDWTPNADHAPIYAAIASGAFERAGLDVKLRTPSDPAAALKLVAAKKVDLAISYQPDLLLARDKGLKVAAVGALVQKPLTSLMSLSKDVRSVRDLEGKTVGTAGIPYQSAYLRAIVRRAGVPRSKVKEVNVGFNLSAALVGKKVDATLGAFWNIEGIELRRKGRKVRVTPVDRLGVPTYQELVFAGQMDALRSNGAVLRRFFQALADGERALERDPRPAIDALLKADPGLDRATLTEQVKATMPAFRPSDPQFPWGFMNTREWRAYGQWMVDHKLIGTLPTPTSLTNEYLPGQGI